MNIGIATTCADQDEMLAARTYASALAPCHQVSVYQRVNRTMPWELTADRTGKSLTFSPPGTIDWEDFRAWIYRHRLDAVLFIRPHSWDIALKCLDLGVLCGACIGDVTAETIAFYKLFDFLICHTLRDYNLFHNHPQAMYIPWGTDLDLFQPQPPQNNTGSVRFFHIAGAGTLKDTRLLARAFRQVRGEAQLIIHAPDGLDRLSGAGSLIGDDHRVTLIRSGVPAPGLYFLGDVYVHPARRERQGETIVEALACGLPVITTDCAPMNEFIQHDYNGRQVVVALSEAGPSSDYWPDQICWEMALTQAMQFYADHPEQVACQKVQARRYATEYLDWNANSAPLGKMLAGIRRLPKPRKVRATAGRYARARLGEDYLAAARATSQSRQVGTTLQQLVAATWYSPARLLDLSAARVAYRSLAGLAGFHQK